MAACYPETIYRRLAEMDLGESTFQEFESHVQICEKCQIHLQRMIDCDGEPGSPSAVDHGSAPFPELPGFQIEARLGFGGMGVVYLAWQLELERYVAIKLVSEGPSPDAAARKRWLNEARSLSRVVHSRVVQIHQVGESARGLYLVMEYVAGGSLKERLRAGPLLPRQAAELLEQLARAVHHLHERGLWHLDIKPSNILLGGAPGAAWEEVVAKISDFGIAYIDGQSGVTLTALAGPRGTPPYMAPEQVVSRPGTLGSWTDTYGLGATLYHLLRGEPPFEAESTVELLNQIRDEKPLRPRRFNPRIPRDLETICLKCLEKDPERRYVSAEALAEDLRRWLDHQPIKARPVSFLGHARGWCRRYPAVAGLLTLLAMTIVASFVVLVGALRDVQARHQIASDALGDFVDLENRDVVSDEGRGGDALESLLTRLRIHQRRLYEARPDDRSERDRLVDINLSLARRFRDINHAEKADELLADCERILNSSSNQDPSDIARLKGLARAHRIMGELTRVRRRYLETIRIFRGALLEWRAIHSLSPSLGDPDMILACYSNLGSASIAISRWDDARRWYEESARLIESLSESEASRPGVIACHIETLIALGDVEKASRVFRDYTGSDVGVLCQSVQVAGSLLSGANRMPPGEGQTSRRKHALNLLRGVIGRVEAALYEDRLYIQIHSDLYFLLGSALSDLGEPDEAIAELRHFVSIQRIWVDRLRSNPALLKSVIRPVTLLAGLIVSRDDKGSATPRLLDRWNIVKSIDLEIDPNPSSIATLGWGFLETQGVLATEYRGKKRLKEAEELVGEMVALADSLVRDFPNDPYAHLARCEARVQVAKNLWKTAGPREVKPALQRAIQSARRALELDPKNEEAKARVFDLTRRYDGIEDSAE